MPRWFRAAHFALKIIYLIEHRLVRGRLFLDRPIRIIYRSRYEKGARFEARNRRA